MKNLKIYHLVTFLPLLIIFYLFNFKYIGIELFGILIIFYSFIFRPIIDFIKLNRKGLVTKSQFIKSLGFIRFKYFSELMFEE